MDPTEKLIGKVAGIVLILAGLGIAIYDLSQGYFSLIFFLFSLIFILVGLAAIFKDRAGRIIDQLVIRINAEYLINFFLILFSALGFVLLFFAVKFPENVPLYGWVTIALFIAVPLFILYGMIFGFQMSEKNYKRQVEYQNVLTFDKEKMSVRMPVVEKNYSINWNTIDTILYTDYTESDYRNYIFYLSQPPVYQDIEPKKWYNKLFKRDFTHKKIWISDDYKNSHQIPEMVGKYLGNSKEIDLDPMRKGILVSSDTTVKGNKSTTLKKFKPNRNFDPVQVIYDKYDRNVEDIRKRDGAI